MANEEDNFDIDIYGDGDGEYREEGQLESEVPDPLEETHNDAVISSSPEPTANGVSRTDADGDENRIAGDADDPSPKALQPPKHAPQTQGLKRKEVADERSIDQGATAALLVSELPWWITDDDIRGWANQSECEDELEDITFSEHKVNGKSKGQAYILLKSPQAATATKHRIDYFGEGEKYRQRFTITFANPFSNPFKTLPKDGPMRTGNQPSRATSVTYNSGGNFGPPQQTGYTNGGFRGRGGYNNRAGPLNTGGYGRGGFQQPMPGSYQNLTMNGFPPNSMGMPSFNYQHRGGMMGMRGNGGSMRGNRGGMNPAAAMGMGMHGMNMGGMPNQMGGMGVGMSPMNGGMGMQGMHRAFTYSPVSTARTVVSHGSMLVPRHSHANSTASTSDPPAYSKVDSASSHSTRAASRSSLSYSSSATHLERAPVQYSNLGSIGFQAAPSHYNPAFYPQAGPAGGPNEASWNPHGAKRTRQE